MDELLGGGLLRRSVTLLSGSAGVGKSTFGMQFILEGTRNREPGLYVTLEEGPDQLLASADALGLPLRAAVGKGLAEILYVSSEHLRAGQFLTVLADKVQSLHASRLVLDAATHMMPAHVDPEELRHVLYKLMVRLKTLGVTTVLTLEAPSLSSTEHVTEQSLSPIADNLLMLRYKDEDGCLSPTLTVVKTRGSDHDRGTHAVRLGKGGMRVGDAGSEPVEPTNRRRR